MSSTQDYLRECSQSRADVSRQNPVKKGYRKPALKRLGVLRSVAASKVSDSGGCYIRW